MKTGLIKSMGVLLVAIIALTLVAPDTSAVVRRPRLADGVYFGGLFGYQAIGGDFEGNSYISVPSLNEQINIPEIDGGMGFGIVGGVKRGRGALEVSYTHSSHDATHNNNGTDVVFQAFNFDAKYYPVPHLPTQPFLMVGLCVPWLKAENVSTYGSIVDDARFTGIGLNVGAGIMLKFTPRMALTSTVGYRWISYGTAKGASKEKIDIPNLNGSGMMFHAGLIFTFPSRF